MPATGSWRRRSGTARRAPAIRSCTRTSWSRTSDAGRRPVVGARRPAALRARPDGGLPLPGGAARRAHAALGLEWTPVRNGIAEIDGVPSDVLRAFSRRRAEIEAALERARDLGRRAPPRWRRLATRRAKDYAASRPRSSSTEWRARAAELGLGRARPRALIGRARARAAGAGDVAADARRTSLAPDGLTRGASTFSRRDVVQALCERAPGRSADRRGRIERAADHFLRSTASCRWSRRRRDARRGFRRRDGRVVPVDRGELRYSTVEHARARAAADRPGASPDATARVGVAARPCGARCAARPTLSGEQRRDGRAACASTATASPSSRAEPGRARRSRSPPRARRGRRAGHPVLGVGGRATRRARARATGRHPSTSVAALLAELERRRRCPAVRARGRRGRHGADAELAECSTTSSAAAASSCSSATTASCPSSRPAARSMGSSAGARDRAHREPPPGPRAGSATRSSSCAAAAPRRRSPRYEAHGRVDIEADQDRARSASSPTGGRRATRDGA